MFVFCPISSPVSMFFFLSRVGFSWFFYIYQRIIISPARHLLTRSSLGQYRHPAPAPAKRWTMLAVANNDWLRYCLMELICHNKRHALFSSDSKTLLYELPKFTLKGTLQSKTKIAALQYGTGIVAIVSQSKVRIYDFLLSRDVYDFESYLKITRVGLFKNLLIVASAERMLIHDLRSRSNQCYIPIQEGATVFMSHEYYNLSICYYLETHLLASRSIWLNHVTRIEGVKFTLAAYSLSATLIALALKNVLSIYDQGDLVKVYGFDFEILEMVVAGEYFFLKLGDGAVVGCSPDRQVRFLEWEEVAVDFWDHEYETVLLGGEDSLLEVGKGIAKRYRLVHAQECSISDMRGKVNRLAISEQQVESLPSDLA